MPRRQLLEEELESRLCAICGSNRMKRSGGLNRHWIRYRFVPDEVRRDDIDPEALICGACYRNEYYKTEGYETKRVEAYRKKRDKRISKESYCTSAICMEQRKIIVRPDEYYLLYNKCLSCMTPHAKNLLRCPCCSHVMRTHARGGKQMEKRRIE